MPELPEVETIRRQLRPALVDREIGAVDAHSSEKFQPALEAAGTTITDLRRRGKYLIFDLDDGHEMLAHLGMTGSFRIDPSTTGSPDHERVGPHVRAVWQLDGGEDLIFRDIRRFGRLRVVPAGEYEGVPTLAAMGPEPLSDDFTGASLHHAVKRSTRAIKTQLLSQRPVAGVGNIYADEALFLAGIHPRRSRVGRDRCDTLAQTIKGVIAQGIDNGGTTLRDYVDAAGDEGSNQHALHVYGRAGEPCDQCGETLRSIVLDARTTCFCPACQT